MGAILVVFSATVSLAADTMVFQTKMGAVTFPHKKHQEMLKSCKPCHEKTPGKIEGFNKDAAHKLCKGCHEAKGAGPTGCKDCHKK
jgi:formylmethanofuran dehydrogenase subunit E